MSTQGELMGASPAQDYLQELHREYAGVTEGNVATYIPELAKANPDWFGICLVTVTGAIYQVGDSLQPFTIQSISKPFVYGLALEDQGRSEVLARVGMEPTGDAFNSISLDPGTGRPRNPMINAGAIATTGLISGKTPSLRRKRILDMLGTCAGRELEVDERVYRSESETGHRNRAIGHMLRNFDMLTGDPIAAVELYFKQCSVSVTCRDLGIMAATLANRGVNPVTGDHAIRGEYVESVLSVMGSCGMYDFAGEWIYNIGMPAKSGVAGGIIAVLPGQLGIGVFSPPLDTHGNSVRGIRVCDELSRRLNLHLFNLPNSARSVIRVKSNGAEFNSSRVRTARESQALHQFGARIRSYQLQGHLVFANTDIVVRDIVEKFSELDSVVLDLRRVVGLNESSCHLFYRLLMKFSQNARALLFTHTGHLPLLRRFMKAKLGNHFEAWFRSFEDNDPALEWCENRLLNSVLPAAGSDAAIARKDYDLFNGLSEEEVSVVEPLLQRRAFVSGQIIIHIGEEAAHIFFLGRGRVSVLVNGTSGVSRRLATFSPGMTFGEMAAIDRAPRSAIVRADTDVECDVLALDDLAAIGRSHPAVKIKLLENLCRDLSRKLRKANREISVLE